MILANHRITALATNKSNILGKNLLSEWVGYIFSSDDTSQQRVI